MRKSRRTEKPVALAPRKVDVGVLVTRIQGRTEDPYALFSDERIRATHQLPNPPSTL